MVLGLGLFWMHTLHGDIRIDNRKLGMHFLGVFFSMLVISDITKTGAQLVSYRRAL
jgi:hypothetical protein